MKKFIYYLKIFFKGLGDISMCDICSYDKDPYNYINKNYEIRN